MTNVSAWKRSLPLQEKSVENLDQQIRNVTAGNTADGHASDMRPIAIRKELLTEAGPSFRRLFRNLAYFSGSELSDSTRTALIWKGLALARRYGDGAFASRTGAIVAAWFLAIRPRYITGKAGMQAILNDGLQARERFRKKRKQKRIDALAARLREATRPPLRPVVWKNDEYRVESLIHPFHLWEEGVARRNCLSRIVLDLPDNHPANTITPETLAALAYWRIMKDHKAEILSLRKGPSRLGLAMLSREHLFDLESVGSRDNYELFVQAVLELRAARGWGVAALKRRQRT